MKLPNGVIVVLILYTCDITGASCYLLPKACLPLPARLNATDQGLSFEMHEGNAPAVSHAHRLPSTAGGMTRLAYARAKAGGIALEGNASGRMTRRDNSGHSPRICFPENRKTASPLLDAALASCFSELAHANAIARSLQTACPPATARQMSRAFAVRRLVGGGLYACSSSLKCLAKITRDSSRRRGATCVANSRMLLRARSSRMFPMWNWISRLPTSVSRTKSMICR